MERTLESRVAIVTGGAQGIGLAIASLLARAGAQVAIADIGDQTAEQAVAMLRSDGLQALAVAVDVTDESSLTRMLQVSATTHPCGCRHSRGPNSRRVTRDTMGTIINLQKK